MKKFNLLKLFLTTIIAFAATAFVACVDDNEDTEAPYLNVTPTTVAFNAEGEPVDGDGSFTIETNRHWTATVQGSKDWVTLSATEGDGPAKVAISIPAGVSDAANVVIKISNQMGPLMSKTIAITRGEIAPVVAIYNETFGDTAPSSSPFPFVDQFTGWVKSGDGSSEVTYEGASASLRMSGKLSGGYYNASGADKMFFGANANFVVKKITLTAEQTNLKLTFGGSYSKNVAGVYDNTFYPEKFHFSLSANGTTWSDPVTYETEKADEFWVLATSNFTLKNPTTSLYIKFVADEASVFAIDDPTLTTGNGGQVIDLEGGAPSTDLTVSPSAVTLAATSGATATFAITTTTAWTATVGGAGYSISPASGTGNGTITVTSTAANTDSSVKSLGNVTVANGTVTKTVAVSQSGTGGGGGGNTVLVDFTQGASIATPALPETKTTSTTPVSYTIGGSEYKIATSNDGGYYWFENNYDGVPANPDGSRPRSLYFGKLGAYIELPAISGKTLTKLVLTSPIGASGKVNYKIATTAAADVAGGASTNLPANGTITFNLTGTTANTAYRIYVDNANNGQLSKIEMSFDGGGVEPTTPEITAVNPTSLAFEAAGGTKTVAVTVANQGSNALSVSGLSGILSATVSGTTVTVVSAANTTTAAVNQTMTIALAGGNSKTVAVSVAATGETPPPAGELTLVTKVAGLTAGKYYMAGFAKENYNVWSGELDYGKCITTPYTWNATTKKLTVNAGETDNAAEVTLVAVSGVANAFYIQIGAKYLSVSKEGKNVFALVDTAGDNYWTLSDMDENGVQGIAKAFPSKMCTSVTATSTFIRTYVTTNTTGIGGVAFFKK